MKRKFSFSSPGRRGPSDPWFRVGTVDVTTTVFVVALGVLFMFLWAASPNLLHPLVLTTQLVRRGEIWRILTWPLAISPSLQAVITLAVFWYFGRSLEQLFGRVRFTRFLLALTVIPAVLLTLASYVSPSLNGAAYGLSLIELGVFVCFVAESPNARFFFGLQAWMIAAFFVGIDVLTFLGHRDWGALLLLLFILAVGLLLTRAYGFAADQTWIPKVAVPGAASGGPGSKKRGGKMSAVVQGPWGGAPGVASDTVAQAEMDRLLDKIASSGMDSLTPDEKRRLKAHSKRLRGDG